MNEKDSFKLLENNSNNNLKDKEKFDDKIITKIYQYKESNYESLYKIKSFCDINIDNKWIVGKILNISEDVATVTDFENSNNYTKVFLFESEKISYFRKYSKPNEKRIANERDTIENLKNIQSFILLLIDYYFGNFDNIIFNSIFS